MLQATEIPKTIVDLGGAGIIIAVGLYIAEKVVTLSSRFRRNGNITHAGQYRGPSGTTAFGTQEDSIIARDCVHRIDKKTDDMVVCIQKLTYLQEKVVNILEKESSNRR